MANFPPNRPGFLRQAVVEGKAGETVQEKNSWGLAGAE